MWCFKFTKNGTIAFGVGDSVGSKQFKHGEITGFEIIEDNFKDKFTDALDNAKRTCFDESSRKIADSCIGEPVFIPVTKDGQDTNLCVMEVDIEPLSDKCIDSFFKINRSLLQPDEVKNMKKIESNFTLFVRKGSSTEKVDAEVFIYKPLQDRIKERQLFDQRKRQNIKHPLERPLDKLERLLCNGLDQFDSSFCPILVFSKPTTTQRQNDEWMKDMHFIRLIQFHCVFDFDDSSNVNGLCKNYRDKENCLIHSQEIFEDFSKNLTKLQSDLGIPHDPKAVWTFANGRIDSIPVRPHLDRKKWITEYVGIRDAVSFYSQTISKRRAVIIFFLLSDDFNGLIETFNECTSRFGWDRILIITTDDHILKQIKRLIEREEKGTSEQVEQRSIYGKGITWNHICSALCRLSGQTEDILIKIPISAGGDGVPVDINFKDALTDLELLGTMQCKDVSQNDTFNLRMEKQFYKGGKVNWYNFSLGHVCTRHIFTQIKTHLQELFAYADEYSDRIAITVTINYQPGAGASTLGRHLLWEFHKQYRCAIIKKITSNTVGNILSLWQYKETSRRDPILLLIDEVSEEEFFPYQLGHKLEKQFQKLELSRESPVCYMLIFQRGLEFDRKSTYMDMDFKIQLKHKMTDEEIFWFEEKLKKMEKRKQLYRPDNLISFLILRKDFDTSYINKTIRNLLKSFEGESEDFNLLAFVALISHYANSSFNTKRACIPIECCDELIGITYCKDKAWDFWERTLSDEKRMFLLTEENTWYSSKFKFKEIRISHPTIALAILNALHETHIPLGDLVLRFLNSSVLKSSSLRSNGVIDYKTQEMLKRRLKEEYNDNQNTAFSPLIEEIIRRDGWRKAVSVLEKGVDIFSDCYIVQTLSRLLSKKKQFEEAINWATKSKDYAKTTEERRFCYQSLGCALRDQFESTMGDNAEAKKAIHSIKRLLEALKLFQDAGETVHNSDEIRVLYCSHDIVRTILLCGKFIMETVQFQSNIDRKRLLIDPYYNPEELQDAWKEIRKTTFSFFKIGQDSFDMIQRKLCYEPIYYYHNPQKLHRFHRRLHCDYPELRTKFIELFGEDSEEPNEETPEVVDEWHRRKILKLIGNNYMDLYNSVYLEFKKRNINLVEALKLCIEVQGHLKYIANKTSHDLINLVSVNILLSTLREYHTNITYSAPTIKDLIGYCELSFQEKGDHADQAYFFLSMILWPSSVNDKNYDNDLFGKTLNHFIHHKKSKPKKKFKMDAKGENNVTRPTAQFFLSNGIGLNKVCHRFDIYKSSGDNLDEVKVWKREDVRRKIKRVTGYFHKAKQYIAFENDLSPGEEIQIHNLRTSKIKSEDWVTFVLGFSIAGPIAYDVELVEKEKTLAPQSPLLEVRPCDRSATYLKKSVHQLESLIQTMETLKLKEKESLTSNEEILLEDEACIKEVLDLKKYDTSAS